MNFEIESDDNLIWQARADCRVVITRMQLYVPLITFNSEGQSSYMSQYLKTHKWTYLRENIERSNSSRQRAGHFRISTGISKPRYVFVLIINDSYGVSLSKGQLETLSRADNNNSAITIRLARKGLSGPHELMLTKTQGRVVQSWVKITQG